MSVIGAEIGELHTLTASFSRQSGVVEQLMSELSAQLHSTYWQGGAAERFRSAWETEYRPALRSLSAALVDASDEVRRRAEALHAAGA
jgi:WXG100 family type VII secretion target